MVENPAARNFPLSSTEAQREERDQKKEVETYNLNRYNKDI